jgi:hypothetical protein
VLAARQCDNPLWTAVHACQEPQPSQVGLEPGGHAENCRLNSLGSRSRGLGKLAKSRFVAHELPHFPGCQEASDVLGKSGSALRRTWGTISWPNDLIAPGNPRSGGRRILQARRFRAAVRHPVRLRRRRAWGRSRPTSGSGQQGALIGSGEDYAVRRLLNHSGNLTGIMR